MISKTKHDYIELSLVYLFAVILIVLLSTVSLPKVNTLTGVIAPHKKDEPAVLFSPAAFANISIRGKAYVVYDIVNKNIIASKNPQEVLPLASLTKIMTGLTALSLAKDTTNIIIEPGSVDGGYDLGLAEGQRWKLSELLKYTLVFSSNDGAQAIADGLGGRDFFVAEMNNEAAKLGLATMTFTQPAGLDIKGQIGGKGSALDVARMFGIARKEFPEILDATTKARATVLASSGKISGIPNTNQEIGHFLGAEGSKTGFTEDAGGNLAIVVDPTVGHPVVIVVLGSTVADRFTDVDNLYKALILSIDARE
jgi:D-alanyl-D-alanine carboxypeptidase (penicillin-binding protein 5/6)